MKTTYKGFELSVTREECLGGWSMLYYSIFRLSDGYELTSGFEETKDTVKTMLKCLKGRVDDYLENSGDYEK